MAKMNFYTANGWAGSNYDSNLQTKKDVATKVRAAVSDSAKILTLAHIRIDFGELMQTVGNER